MRGGLNRSNLLIAYLQPRRRATELYPTDAAQVQTERDREKPLQQQPSVIGDNFWVGFSQKRAF